MIEKSSKMPKFIKRLFWDIDIKKLRIKKHTHYIIRRIIDYGDMKDVQWMKKNFSVAEIVSTVKKSKGISKKSAYFWSVYYNIPSKEIECLKPYYLKELRPF